MRALLKWMVTLLVALLFVLTTQFVVLNWLMGCSSWTYAHTCVTPTEFIQMIFGKAAASELKVTSDRKDWEERISPSWQVRRENKHRQQALDEFTKDVENELENFRINPQPDIPIWPRLDIEELENALSKSK